MADTTRDGVKQIVILLGVLATFVGGALGGSWVHLRMMEASATAPATPAPPLVVAAAPPATAGEVRGLPESEAIHADVYFDFKSARLRADSVGLLQEKASLVTRSGGWVVLVQGFADRQGPAEYNRKLAQRRADEVKRFLTELGVPETSIKVVTVGPEGALCDDPGQECQRLNRRVHLEMRKLTRITSTAPPVTSPAAPSPVAVSSPDSER